MNSKKELNVDLEAANKTIETLKQKVVAFYEGTYVTQFQKRLDNLRIREEESRRKRDLIEIKNNELQKYNDRLEGEVKQRTRAIKTIVDNVRSGILLVNSELIVQEGSTASCKELFQNEFVDHQQLTDLLKLSQRDKEHFQVLVDQVFEDILPPQLTIKEVPSKFRMNNGRIICLQGEPVYDESNRLSLIIFTISDITDLELAQKEINTNRVLISILKNKDSFSNFIYDTVSQLETARSCSSDTRALKRIFHTIKGNSASYGLDDSVRLIHKIEEDSDFTENSIDLIEKSFTEFLDSNFTILEMRFTKTIDHKFEVTKNQIKHLNEIISNKDEISHHDLRKWTASLVQKPVSSMLGQIKPFVYKMAEKLGKKVSFTLEGSDVLVDYETMRPFFSTLTHLLRNAVDHGVERPDKRGPKPMVASVSLKIEDLHDQYVITVTDDGRGIDTKAVADKALSQNMVTQEELNKLTNDEIMRLVFLDKLSTAPVTTDISGRGIGMSAVLSEVEKCYGTIEIQSYQGKGTKFTIEIPKPEIFRRKILAS
jgi:two-component system chemotaxis sensor kinase CheA